MKENTPQKDSTGEASQSSQGAWQLAKVQALYTGPNPDLINVAKRFSRYTHPKTHSIPTQIVSKACVSIEKIPPAQNW